MRKAEPIASRPLRIAGIEIPVADQTPLALAFMAVFQRQEKEILELRDEIQRLKGKTRRPKITLSGLLKHPLPPK